MKIYDFTQAPNPRRVRVFLAEKGLTVPYEQINIGTADNRKPDFLKINPMGTLPVLEVLSMAAGSFRNTSDFFKGRIPQVKEYGDVCKAAALKRLEWLDTVLADREFIAGPRYTIADITALIGIDFGRTTGIRIQENQKNLARWHQAVSSRPSAKA